MMLRRLLASLRSAPKRARFNSTSSASVNTSHAQSTRILVAAALLGAGAAGYMLGSAKSPVISPPSISSTAHYGSKAHFEKAISELQAALGEDKVSIDSEDLHAHGYSENDHHPGISHSVVTYPASTEDVVTIVQIANKYRMPITPYSGGTALEGHTTGYKGGGICVDVSVNMNRILEVHEKDSDAVCQPGVGWMELNEKLKDQGIPLFFPLDPGPGATLGGMLSTGCSGTNAVRYGTGKGEWFLNATIVLPTGEVIKTRQRSRKSSAGWDVTKLFIGAEGTLGIVTEVTVRLAPVLPTMVAVVQFDDVRKATEAVIEIMKRGVGIQCVELCDERFMTSVNLFGSSTGGKRRYPEKDTLFIKLQGPTLQSLKESASIVKEVASQKEFGGTGWMEATDAAEQHSIWMDRKNALWSGLALGAKGMEDRGQGGRSIASWSTDVCVPISRLPDLVYETKDDLSKCGLIYNMVGHVGDGNFHTQLILRIDATDSEDATEEERRIIKAEADEDLRVAQEIVHRMVQRAIRLEGTCSGEHGVGIGKRKYLKQELGEGTVALMQKIKKTVDPLGIMNPGKLYPDDEPPSATTNEH